MRPLIFAFAEKPNLHELDFSIIEYSTGQNLSVLKGTNFPAISYASLDTETFTKTNGESSDSDFNNNLKLKYLLDTSTETRELNEMSDSDPQFKGLRHLMDTQTFTESVELTDSDK